MNNSLIWWRNLLVTLTQMITWTWQGYCYQHFLALGNSKRNHWKTWKPADEVMDAWSNKDVDEEIEDPARIKSASDALHVMDKVIRFSHQFDNKELFESIAKVIEGLQDVQTLRRRQTKITTFFAKKWIVM